MRKDFTDRTHCYVIYYGHWAHHVLTSYSHTNFQILGQKIQVPKLNGLSACLSLHQKFGQLITTSLAYILSKFDHKTIIDLGMKPDSRK